MCSTFNIDLSFLKQLFAYILIFSTFVFPIFLCSTNRIINGHKCVLKSNKTCESYDVQFTTQSMNLIYVEDINFKTRLFLIQSSFILKHAFQFEDNKISIKIISAFFMFSSKCASSCLMKSLKRSNLI